MADLQKKYEEYYLFVAEKIRKHGKQNPNFKSDFDLDYGTLRKHCEKIEGLGNILKNMKKKKMVDFGDQGMFKDNSIISLIGDYNAESVSTQITYDEINSKVQTEKTSHQKTAGW